ncbi:MAG: transcriptional regulator [Armatimonadetes bacterium]|nr:transcriptional regulator [Armatimonadota bacterium]
MLLGRHLRKLRKQQKISLIEFARLTGFSPSYISSIERGLKKAGPSFVQVASTVLQISPTYLKSCSEDILEGRQVRELREERGLNTAELAEISDIPEEVIKKIEQGEAVPTTREAQKLSEALNHPLGEPVNVEESSFFAQLGQRVRTIRREQGLGVKELAERVGVSPGLISQIERGQSVPLLETLEKIASCLNVTLVNLFAEEYDVARALQNFDEYSMETICDPKVQVLLSAVRDCNGQEFRFILNFISFFQEEKRNFRNHQKH